MFPSVVLSVFSRIIPITLAPLGATAHTQLHPATFYLLRCLLTRSLMCCSIGACAVWVVLFAVAVLFTSWPRFPVVNFRCLLSLIRASNGRSCARSVGYCISYPLPLFCSPTCVVLSVALTTMYVCMYALFALACLDSPSIYLARHSSTTLRPLIAVVQHFRSRWSDGGGGRGRLDCGGLHSDDLRRTDQYVVAKSFCPAPSSPGHLPDCDTGNLSAAAVVADLYQSSLCWRMGCPVRRSILWSHTMFLASQAGLSIRPFVAYSLSDRYCVN